MTPASAAAATTTATSTTTPPPPRPFDIQPAAIPDGPGVYIMKDGQGRIIYIGKAKSLRKRVRSYFGNKTHDNYKTQRLVELVAGVEFVITDTEGEAFLLESNMIKRHRPRFNIELKDQQRYTYLRISDEEYPRLLVARRTRDGRFLGKGQTFGPFVQGSSKILTVGALRKAFQIRICKTLPKKVCLEYHLGNCEGPCEFESAQKRYRGHVDALKDVLAGSDQLKVFSEKLRLQMKEAADARHFERAIEIRDTLVRLDGLNSGQKMERVKSSDEEYFGVAVRDHTAVVMTFRMIHGVIRDSDKFVFDAMADNTFAGFLYQYYTTRRIPHHIILSEMPQDAGLLESLLSERAGHAVDLSVPRRGRRKEMIDLILRNVAIVHESGADDSAGGTGGSYDRTGGPSRAGDGRIGSGRPTSAESPGLLQLQDALGLARIPHVIECFDISNHGEAFAVGSMSRFVGGVPDKSGYRRFRIKTVRGRDDYAMISEVVHRRYRRILDKRADGRGGNGDADNRDRNDDYAATTADPCTDKKTAELPDLVVIDGGKGQLGAALKSLYKLGLHDLPCISLAKENEEVYVPGRSDPVVIPRSDQSLKILQHARDESHRFGVSYNRTLQKKMMQNR